MKPLTKPRPGWFFSKGRFVLHFNVAKTYFWSEDAQVTDRNTKERRTYLISLHRFEREDGGNLIQLVIGPIKVTLGWVQNPKRRTKIFRFTT